MSDLPVTSAKLTVVEAVNLSLRAIGSSPSPSEEAISRSADALSAYNALLFESRAAQDRPGGWFFNREKGVTLDPNVSGEITLPNNCLQVDLSETYQLKNWLRRGNRIYDVDKQTFNIGSAIKVDMVVLLQWDDLPHAASYYIANRTALKFSAGRPVSQQAARLLEIDTQAALAALADADATADDAQAYLVNPHFQYMGKR